MAENTKIEWTDHTFNPWIGCSKISPACDNCYAEELMDTRHGRAKWGPGNPRSRTAFSTWKNPAKWQRQAAAFFEKHGRRQRVFCASLADVFDNEVPADWRRDLFDVIDATPDLDWLLLTKRIGNVEKMLRAMERAEPPRNVWLGATICNQDEANRDIPKLMKIPAVVRFLSLEPLLGEIDLRKLRPDGISFTVDALTGKGVHFLGMTALIGKVHWVIVGGESGRKARPMQKKWATSLRDQCAEAGTAFLFKQWGEFAPVAESDGDERPGGVGMVRIGKGTAGRLLDGRTHDEFPV